jgi:hypothetical protein
MDKNAPNHGGNKAVEEFHHDVRIFAHAHDGPDETDRYQKITGDFFGPRKRTVQHIAGEELEEDVSGQNPEDKEYNVIFDTELPPLYGRVHDLVKFHRIENFLILFRHLPSLFARLD